MKKTFFSEHLGSGTPVSDNPVVANAFALDKPHVEYHSPQESTKFHTQRGIELHLSVQGRAVFHVDGRNYVQARRHGLLFRGANPHQFAADPAHRFERSVICFDVDQFGKANTTRPILDLSWLPERGCFPFALGEQDFMRADDLARWFRYEVNLELNGWREAALGVILNLLALVRRNGVAGDSDSNRVATRSHQIDLVSFVATHVRNNLSEELSLSSVARAFKVSPEHLTRSFSKHFGISFHRFVLFERVAKAKELLRSHPQTSVIDIAFSLGFQSSWHFSRVFKKHSNLTPTEFRENSV